MALVLSLVACMVARDGHSMDDASSTPSCNSVTAAEGVGRLCVRAHVQDQGWDTYPTCSRSDGMAVTVGTSGKNRAIEALEISVNGG
ncbi:hypothetical protein [Streptomyces xanthophaeus]